MIELSLGTWRVTIQRKLPEVRDITRMYDAASWIWHPVVALLGYSRSYEKLFNEMAIKNELAHLHDGAMVLDAGIGTGAFSMALARSFPRALSFHGIDISTLMLSKARANLRQLTRSNLTLQLHYGDVDCLPYPDSNFDMVISAHMLEYSQDPLQTIKEMVRVLRAGGNMLIVTTRVNHINRWHGLRWRYCSIDTQQLQNLMQQAGLCNVRCCRLGAGLSLAGLLSAAYIGRKQEVFGSLG